MKTKTHITYWFVLLITSMFFVTSCDDGDSNPNPNIPLQQADGDGTDADADGQGLPDFFVELAAPTTSTTVSEGQSYTVQIMNPSEVDQDIDVNISYSGSGQYGQDYTFGGPDIKSVDADGAVVTIKKSLKMAEIIIDVIRDGISEGNEAVTIAVEGAVAEDGTEFNVESNDTDQFSTTISILSPNNIASVATSQIDVTVSANRSAFVPITLDLPAIVQTTFTYSITAESAPFGVPVSDLVNDVTGGTITFEAGENKKSIRIDILDAAFNNCQVNLRVSLDPAGIISDDNELAISPSNDETVISTEGPDCRPAYCVPAVVSPGFFWIDQFDFGGLSNVSGQNGGYADFTDLQVLNVQRGALSPFIFVDYGNFNPGFNYTMRLQFYFDWNQDGVFSSSEVAVDIATGANNTASGFIPIPASAELGFTKLRVSLKFATGNSFTPCETFNFGEVEDYLINVTDNILPQIEGESGFSANEVEDGIKILFTNNDPSTASTSFDLLIEDIVVSVPIRFYNASDELVTSITANSERTTVEIDKFKPGRYTIKASSDGKEVSTSIELD